MAPRPRGDRSFIGCSFTTLEHCRCDQVLTQRRKGAEGKEPKSQGNDCQGNNSCSPDNHSPDLFPPLPLWASASKPSTESRPLSNVHFTAAYTLCTSS